MNRKQRRKTVNVDTTNLERAIERAEKGKIKVENKTLQGFLDNLGNEGAPKKPQGSVADVMAKAERDNLLGKFHQAPKTKKTD